MNIDTEKYAFYKAEDSFIYNEMFVWNVYGACEEEIKNMNVLDIGGHYGSFSNICNDLGAKQIIAVEANPFNYLKFIKYTKDIPNIKCINAAITDNYGEIVTIDNRGGCSTVGNGTINVATITLKDVVDLFPSNEDIFLKIDIEGGEYKAFYSSESSTIRRFKYIAMELHQGEHPNSYQELDNYIKSLGYIELTRGSFFINNKDGSVTENTAFAIKYKRV
jgi:FkbM family methyltransferase